MILNGIASVFFEQGKFDMCRKFVTKAYNMAKKANDPEMIKTLAGDMVLLNNKEKKFNEAEKYLTIARKFAYENCNDLATFDTYEAETRFHQKDYDKVLNLASSIMKNDCASPDNKGLIMIYLINIYSERGEFQKAAAYESEAARLCSLKNKDYLFESLSSMYERSGNLSKALEMKDSMITYHDSVIKLNNQRLVQGANTKLEIIKYKAETEKQIAMIHQRYILWVSGGCILLLILVITLIAINRQKIKIRHKHQLTEIELEKEQKEKLIAEERMHETELIARHQKEMLKKEIELKKRELSVSAMFVNSRNELICDLSNRLEAINDKYNLDEIAILNRSLHQQLRTYNNEKNMMTSFEAADPEFAKKLLEKHPELLQSDVRFLSYVRMNMSNKEIAMLLNIAPDSCKRRKNRLSKKLQLENSSVLFEYLTQF